MRANLRTTLNFRRASKFCAMILCTAVASGVTRAAAPPPPHQGPQIQGPAWVAILNRPPLSQTLPWFCATNVGSAPLTFYMVLYNTVAAVPSLGILENRTLTLTPLQTTCLNVPTMPPSIVDMWFFGVTIAGESNPAIAFTELQSVLVLAQIMPHTADAEGTFLTPVLLNSVALPGNNAP
jgi:hypothetical protein